MQAVREAQEKLAGLAEAFEEKIRYSNPTQGEVEKVEDQMDQERAKNETK